MKNMVMLTLLMLMLGACGSEVRNMDDPALSNPNNDNTTSTVASDTSTLLNDTLQ